MTPEEGQEFLRSQAVNDASKLVSLASGDDIVLFAAIHGQLHLSTVMSPDESATVVLVPASQIHDLVLLLVQLAFASAPHLPSDPRGGPNDNAS